METHEIALFELIEKFDFEQLNSQQKNVVAMHSSQTEYRQLRSAYLVSAGLNPIAKKEAIVAHLESKLPTPKRATTPKIWQRAIPLWQLVAILLLSQLAWLPTWKQSTEKPLLTLVRDTLWKEVIVEKKIKTYDTVYLSYSQPIKPEENRPALKKATQKERYGSTPLPLKSNPSISGAGGVNDTRNRLQGRSLQQETPPLNLSFVSL